MSGTARLVLTEPEGAETVVLTLNRPGRRNALCVELLQELLDAIAAAEGDPGKRVLILRGAGDAFCSGLDLSEAADAARAHLSGSLIAKALLALSASRLVTVACVHGAAVAGGAGLMTACDMAVAAAGTKIGYPEPRRGLVAGMVMTFLRRQIAERNARELLLTGEIILAERAREIGLVNRVAPTPGASFEEAKLLAAAVLQGGPIAVAATKRLLAEFWHHPLEEDMRRALGVHVESRGSPEAAEGIAAFNEKRPPKWAP
jgi:methylglutaconyl-CoA hydratase